MMRISRSSFQRLLSCLCKNISFLRTTPRVKYRRSRDQPASVPLWRSAEMRRRDFADNINPIVSGSSRRNARFYGSVEFNGTRVTTYRMHRERGSDIVARGNESGATSSWPNDRIWSLEVKALTVFPSPYAFVSARVNFVNAKRKCWKALLF